MGKDPTSQDRKSRTEKTVPVHRASFWRRVLRDHLLKRRWVLQFLGNKIRRPGKPNQRKVSS